ncbi:MAG: flagellar hook-associated protein FlgK, partial [Candidatus Muiribacteriaceae bacterium]
MGLSTFAGLEIGKRGILTSRVALDVTSHNISNANTEGYTRQRADLVASDPYADPAMNAFAVPGQVGTGVEVAQIKRIRMDFFDNRIQHENQKSARYESLYKNLQQVELLLNEPSDNGLRSVLDRFWQSLEDLGNDPETPATRRVVIENGVALTNSFSQAHEELHTLKENINEEILLRVDEVNRIVEEVAGLNQQISNVKNVNDNPNDLLDRRDKLLDDLSEIINISTTYKGTDDELVVSVNGRPVIQGHYFSKLAAVENNENEDMYDVRWEKNHIPQSSDESIVSVFANSSAANQSHTINVTQLARKNRIEGQVSIPYEERELNSEGNGNDIRPGYFEFNGKKIYVDPETDTLNDVVKYMNDSAAGVNVWLDDNRIMMESNNSGEDNRIQLNSGTSDFLRKMGLVNYTEGNTDFVEKDVPLGYGAVAPPPYEGFNVNGEFVTVDPSDTLEDIVGNINKADVGVKAIIEETDSGTYRMILEGTSGEYNFQIDDNGDTILNDLGITYGTGIPAGSTVTMGHLVSDEGIEDKYDRGLTLEVNSQFEIEDAAGNIAVIDIDESNDSLELIKDEINSQLASAFPGPVNAEAEVVKDAEGAFRLRIKSTDPADPEIAIRENDGNLFTNLGITEGTYNSVGPVSFYARNAEFNLDGKDISRSSNKIEGLMPDVDFTVRGLGQTNIEVRQILSGGKLKGLLESRDEVVNRYMDQLDELAYSIVSEVNDVHFNGFGSDGKSQRILFEVYNGISDGYPASGAARSIRMDREMQLDVTRMAAAMAHPDYKTPEGLPVSQGVGSGDNALSMADLKFDLTMDNGTATFNEFFNQTISEVGTRANEAGRIRQNQELLLEKLE